MTKNIADLERDLIAAKGDPKQHAAVRDEIRQAGLRQLVGELDRIANNETTDR